MKHKFSAYVLIAFFSLTAVSYAQEQSADAYDIAAKMKRELNLSDGQVEDIKPIIKEMTAKRQKFLDSLDGEAIIDKNNVKMTMRQFKEEENEKLSKVLTEEQMKKLIEKQNLKESLNKDKIDYSESLGTGQGPNLMGGGSLQY